MKKTLSLLLILVVSMFMAQGAWAADVIKVGVPLSMTGPYTDTGDN